MKPAVFAVLLFAFPVTAAAAPMVTSCHGCSEYQARQVAAARVPLDARQTWFDVYVVDTPGTLLRRYLVEIGRRDGFPYALAWPEAPDPAWQAEFLALAGHWHAVNGLFKSSVDMPADSSVSSVMDVLHSPVAQEQVSLALNRHLLTMVGAVVTSALKMLPRVVWSARPYATVKFADGSTGKFEIRNLEPLDSEGHVFRFEYIEGSARDSDGNPIPDRLESFYGYSADYSNRYNEWIFYRQATLFGVPVRAATGVQKTSVVCVRTEDEVVCWVREHE